MENLEPELYSYTKCEYIYIGFGCKIHELNSKFFAIRIDIRIWRTGIELSFWRRT